MSVYTDFLKFPMVQPTKTRTPQLGPAQAANVLDCVKAL